MPYDGGRYQTKQLIPFTGVSVAGTAASITALAATQIEVPFKAKLTGATRVSTTGGTGAGPTVLLQYSLAGTGAWTSVGTAAFGTDADGTGTSFTVTATNIADNDNIRLAIAAGTAASTHTVNFVVELNEEWE